MVMLWKRQRKQGKKSICYAMGKEKRTEKYTRPLHRWCKEGGFCQGLPILREHVHHYSAHGFQKLRQENSGTITMDSSPQVRTSFHFRNIASYSHPFVWFCQRGRSMEGRGWEEEDAVLYSAAPPARAIRPYGAGPSSLLIIDWGKEAGTSLPSGLLFCNLGGLAWQHHLPIPSHSQVIRQNLNRQKSERTTSKSARW